MNLTWEKFETVFSLLGKMTKERKNGRSGGGGVGRFCHFSFGMTAVFAFFFRLFWVPKGQVFRIHEFGFG